MLKLSANNYFKIPVVSDSNKETKTQKHKNTQLGYQEFIKLIVSLQVEEKEQPVVNTIISSEADKLVDNQTSKH